MVILYSSPQICFLILMINYCNLMLFRLLILWRYILNRFQQHIALVWMLLLMLNLIMMFMNSSTSYCCIYTKMNQTLARVFWFSSLLTMHWSSNGSVCYHIIQRLRYIFFIGVLTLMKLFKLWRYQSLAERYTPLYLWHSCISYL